MAASDKPLTKEGVIGFIARQDWMNPVEETLHQAVHKAFESAGPTGRTIKNALHGTWLGHPLHSALTDIPIGSWTAAVVMDGLEAATGRREFGEGADAAIAIGIAGAVGSAVTGLTDWHDVDPPARRIGLVHALLNTAGLGLFASSYIMRRRRERSAGRKLAMLGFGVATMAARIGGTLVYGQMIGVDHTAGQKLPREFVPVLPEAQLREQEMKRAMADGVPVLLVRRGGRIYAMAETCAHLGGPLSEGKLIGNSVQCPWHGSRYSLEDGSVLDGPSVHPQPCFEARVRNGQIEVRQRTARGEERALTAR